MIQVIVVRKLAILSIILFFIGYSFGLTLRVGTYENPPLSFEKDGEVVGIFPDVLNHIAKSEGWKFEYTYTTQDEAIEKLKSGELDVVFPLGKSEERERFFRFNDEPLFYNWGVVYTKSDLNLKNFLDLEGERIGGMRTDIYYDDETYGIKSLLKKFGVKCSFHDYKTYREVFEALRSGEIDVGIVNRTFGDFHSKEYKLKKTGLIFSPRGLFLMFNKDNPIVDEIISILDDHISKLKKKSDSFYYATIDKYMAGMKVEIPGWIRRILIGSILIIIVLILLVLILRKLVQMKTAELVKKREETLKLYDNIKKTDKLLQDFISLTSKMIFMEMDERKFMDQVLNTALKLIPKARYGSVSVFEGENWRLVTALEHDVEKLRKLPLKRSYAIVPERTIVVDRINERNKNVFPKDLFEEFRKLSKPVKETIISPIRVSGETVGLFTMDIPEGSVENFDDSDVETAENFARIVSAFYMIRKYAQELQEKNRELIAVNEELKATNEELSTTNEEIERLYTDLENTMNKFQDFITLMSQMHMMESNEEYFLNEVLDTALDIVPKAKYGSISLFEDGRWRFVALRGHRMEALKDIPLKKEDSIASTLDRATIVRNLMEWNRRGKPPEVFKALSEATLPIKSSIIAPLKLEDEVVGFISLDIPEDQDEDFTERDVEIVDKFANIVLTFYTLRIREKELKEKTKELEESFERFRKALTVVAKVAVMEIEETTFFNEMLDLALELIPKADYGSISIFEGDEWKFVATRGHDLNILQKIPLKRRYAVVENRVRIIDRILEEDKHTFPEDVMKMMEKASKPIKSTLLAPLMIGEEIFGFFALDIADGKNAIFSEHDVEMVDKFAKIISGFHVVRMYQKSQGKFFKNVILALVKALENYDIYTKGHSERVAAYSTMLAEKMGMNKNNIKMIYWASLVHDMGKIFVPRNILNKPGKLTKEEFEYIKEHPKKSAEILMEVERMEDIARIVMYHHERWDGKGYPYGLKENDIPIESRIIAIADSYDAMISERPYRRAFTKEEALREIERCSGTQFDPDLARLFVKLMRKRR